MAAIVYASPAAPPPVKGSPWLGMVHEFVAFDGSRWELTDWRTGLFLENAGVEGLHLPRETAWVQPQSPVAHGQVYTGGNIEARPVFWPLFMYSESASADWQAVDSAFWAALHPGRVGVWRVTTPLSGTRELMVRADDNSGHSYSLDPLEAGWARYGVALIADDPFWRAERPVVREFSSTAPANFYGGGPVDGPSPGGSPFIISKGNTLDGAEIDNPGDLEAWPVWRVTAAGGDVSSVTLGIGDREVVFPGLIPDGATLTIDTDPLDQQAFLDGENVTDQLTGWGFAAVPSGGAAALSLSMSGLGTVQATIHPRFFRAW